jgi:hypothetical protein
MDEIVQLNPTYKNKEKTQQQTQRSNKSAIQA